MVGGLYDGDGAGGVAFPEFAGDKNNENGFASEEELRSNPAYLSYYFLTVNLNPWLLPSLLSMEDWRFAQQLRGGGSSVVGGIRDRKKGSRAAEDGVGGSFHGCSW